MTIDCLREELPFRCDRRRQTILGAEAGRWDQLSPGNIECLTTEGVTQSKVGLGSFVLTRAPGSAVGRNNPPCFQPAMSSTHVPFQLEGFD